MKLWQLIISSFLCTGNIEHFCSLIIVFYVKENNGRKRQEEDSRAHGRNEMSEGLQVRRHRFRAPVQGKGFRSGQLSRMSRRESSKLSVFSALWIRELLPMFITSLSGQETEDVVRKRGWDRNMDTHHWVPLPHQLAYGSAIDGSSQMLTFCLIDSIFKGRKMLDFVSKPAINCRWNLVHIQARNHALEFKPFLIGHIQYVDSVYAPNYQSILFAIKYFTTFIYHRSFHILAR